MGVDVSFASFLCAREKEGKKLVPLRQRKGGEKGLVFHSLIRTLATPKVLSLGNEKKNFSFPFAFLSFIRTFDFADVTFVRKNKQKQTFVWFFAHLSVTLHQICDF